MADQRACADYVDALNEPVDNTLAAPARGEVDAHLARCAGCRALLTDLRRIKDHGRIARTSGAAAPRVERGALPSECRGCRIAPAAADRLCAGSPPPPASCSQWAQLLVYSAPFRAKPAYMHGEQLCTACTRDARRSGGRQSRQLRCPGSVESIAVELRLAEEHYTKAIAGLEQIAKSQEHELDPQVVATLRRSLQIIDQAIAESRTALSSAPGESPRSGESVRSAAAESRPAAGRHRPHERDAKRQSGRRGADRPKV